MIIPQTVHRATFSSLRATRKAFQITQEVINPHMDPPIKPLRSDSNLSKEIHVQSDDHLSPWFDEWGLWDLIWLCTVIVLGAFIVAVVLTSASVGQ